MKKLMMFVLSLTVFAFAACQDPATTDPAADTAPVDPTTEAVTETLPEEVTEDDTTE